MADNGRRPVALEKDGGAEEGASNRIGNVKTGFGGGPASWCDWWFGDVDGELSDMSKRPWDSPMMGMGEAPSGPKAVAIFPTAALRQQNRWATTGLGGP